MTNDQCARIVRDVALFAAASQDLLEAECFEHALAILARASAREAGNNELHAVNPGTGKTTPQGV